MSSRGARGAPSDWFQKRYSKGGKNVVGVAIYWEEQYLLLQPCSLPNSKL